MPACKKISTFLLISAMMVATNTTAQAAGPTTWARGSAQPRDLLQEGTNTRAPFAFVQYCVKSPAACRSGEVESVEWSRQTRMLVERVNRHVNRSIRPVNDRRESWTANVAAGDCEDFALTKREMLMKAGLPSSVLRMAVATTGSGEGHAVVVVRTSEGDIVLDNRWDRMLVWHETDLTFVKIASNDPRLWRRLL